MSVAAIVVNYNAGEHLLACVQSLLNQSLTDIVVVDNASADDSMQRLRGRFGDRPGVQLLFNPSNFGYGPAVNAASARLQARYLLIINPDCVLHEDGLRHLRLALESDPQAALAAPRVTDQRGRFEAASCRHLPTPRRALMSLSGLGRLARRWPALEGINVSGAADWTEPRAVDATSGACMLLRRDAWEQVGGFDEGYTLHGEDLDLMLRLQQADWSCLFVPAAKATHSQGVSSASRPLWVHREKHRSMVRFFKQYQAPHCGWLQRQLVLLGIRLHWLLLWPWKWLRR